MGTKNPDFQHTLSSFKEDFPSFMESFKAFCQTHCVEEDKVFEIELSLEELIVNSFSYGNKHGTVKVLAQVEKGELKVTLEDNAPPFNLLREAPKPPKGNLMERETGGLGIHLVKNLNDRVEYSGSQKGNRVTLFKSIK